MINIYCLVNSVDNKPFYVGATKLKIENRLRSHVWETKSLFSPTNQKQLFIKKLLSEGHKPIIHLLQIVTINDVNHYEEFFYIMLKRQGFNLLQLPSAFSYKQLTTNFRWLRGDYVRVKKYNKIYFKNILIIIW